jgi:hypothetical protein
MRVCGWGEKREEKKVEWGREWACMKEMKKRERREEKKRKKGKRTRESKWDMCQGVGG